MLAKHFQLTGACNLPVSWQQFLTTLYFCDACLLWPNIEEAKEVSSFQIARKFKENRQMIWEAVTWKRPRVWFGILVRKENIYPHIDLANEKGEFQLTILHFDMSLRIIKTSKSMSKRLRTAEGPHWPHIENIRSNIGCYLRHLLITLSLYLIFFSIVTLGGIVALLL